MAKRIVVKIPEGTPLEKLSPQEIEKLVDQSFGPIKHVTGADELVIQTSDETPATLDLPPPWIAWPRQC